MPILTHKLVVIKNPLIMNILHGIFNIHEADNKIAHLTNISLVLL
jgi:hypothetical protein